MPAIAVTSLNECKKDFSWQFRFARAKAKNSLNDDNPAVNDVIFAANNRPLLDKDESSTTSSSFESTDATSVSTDIGIHLPENLSPAREATSPTSTKTTKKKVHFEPMAKILYIAKVNDKDAKTIWYSPLEMVLLRKESMFTLWCLSYDHLSHLLEGESAAKRYCTRGLKTQMRNEWSFLRADLKRGSLNAVLNEQWVQRKHCKFAGRNGLELADLSAGADSASVVMDGLDRMPPIISDQEAIADQYVKTTYDAKQIALLQGLKDEEEARKIFREA